MVTQVAIISRDGRLEEALRAAGLTTGRMSLESLGSSLPDRSPAALVLDIRGQPQLPAGLAGFCRRHAGTGVVLVTSTLDPHMMLDAMRAGVKECVHDPVTPLALEQAVRRVIVDTPTEHAGQVFAFVGAKGGVGATTLAVSTAAALARTVDGKVLVIDLHLGYGDAALFLGVEPRFSVVDALENVSRLDEAYFRGVAEKTKAGVDLLASSDRVVPGGADVERVRALLDFAVRTYRYTVLDIPRFDVHMLDAVDALSTTVIVAGQDLSSLRSAGRLAHLLRARHGAARVKAVMNRFDRRSEIAHADVERVIGDSVKHLLPSDYAKALEALNIGYPVALEQGPLAESLRRLAADLAGHVKSKPQPSSGLLGRLAFRRA